MSEVVEKDLIDLTAMQIAEQNMDIPGFAEGVRKASIADTGFGKLSGGFSGHFSMMASKGAKTNDLAMKDQPPAALWMFLMSAARMKDQKAVDLFIEPVATSLKNKMETGDIGSLSGPDIPILCDRVAKLVKLDWISEKNTKPLEDLISASANRWLEIEDQKSNKVSAPKS